MLLLIAPVPALAQDFELGDVPPPKAPPPLFTSSLEGGAGWQNLGSFYFGRYGGRTKPGGFVFLDADVQRRADWNTGRGTFFDAHATFNGQDLPSAAVRAGVQGHWRVGAFFDSFTYHESDSARSPFVGVGTAALTLPPTWFGAVSSSLFATLPSLAKPVYLETRWQTVGGDFVLTPRAGYEARIHFDHRDRDGLKSNYITFGQEMLFPVGIFFPQPVAYHSNHLTAALSYADRSWQWSISYALATFSNDVPGVSVPNPYTRSLGIPWPAGGFAGYPFAFGQISLPPDNVSHQVLLQGGYTFSPQARVTARLSYTIQTQNDPFLPYTINSNLSVVTPLPRTSLTGDVRKTYASLGFTGRSSRTWDYTAAYTYDDRNNLTPRDLYSYVANDVQDQQQPIVPGVSRYIRYNLPHSFTFQQAKAEIGYRVAPRTRVSLAYTGDFRTRTYQEVERTDEHAVRAKAQSTFAKGSLWAAYTYATRNGSGYDAAAAWDASHTANYLAAGPQNQSIEYPLLRKYNLADRRRHEAKTGATVDLAASLSADLSATYAKDTYTHSLFGLLSDDNLLADVDVTYALKDRLTATAFYTFERIRARQNGYFLFNTVVNNPAQVWTAHNRDRVHSAGAKLTYVVRPDKLTIGAGYDLSAGNTRIAVADTPFTPLAIVTPLPDATATTHRGSVHAEYFLTAALSLRGGYAIERHVTTDWRYLNSLAPVAQILGSGETEPRYTAHVVWVSARTRF